MLAHQSMMDQILSSACSEEANPNHNPTSNLSRLGTLYRMQMADWLNRLVSHNRAVNPSSIVVPDNEF